MILILTPNIEPESETYRQLMDHVHRLPNIQARVHREQGVERSLTEIYLIGNTSAIAVEDMRMLPGVDRVVRVSEEYRVLGRHRGIHHYTVGQRRGLGIASERRLYVTALDAECNRVVVGGERELEGSAARVERVCWIAGEAPPPGTSAEVKIRHQHAGAPARLEPGDDATLVRFDAPVRALAPGQAAVFYRGDVVLGGGWIAGAAA